MESFENEMNKIMSLKGIITIDMLEVMLKNLAKKYNAIIRWKDRDMKTGKTTYKVITY